MDFDKLTRAVVGVAGLGGLGSNVAVSLARIGVKNLVLVDFDRVEESNLNRQYFFKDQIGEFKTDALSDVIRSIDSDVNIKTYREKLDKDNIINLFKDVDILVEALDDPESKAMLVNEFLLNTRDKKIVAASGIAGFESSNTIKTKRIMKNLYLVGDGSDNRAVREDLYLAPRVCIAANHQANMVVRLILDREDV